MSSLTVHIPDELKSSAKQQAKKDGVTITFIITQVLRSYKDGKLKFGLLSADDEITASFDVSTPAGKKIALASFEAIGK